MKKTVLFFAALAAVVSCRSLIEEWQPVVSSPKAPSAQEYYTPETLPEFAGTFTTIKDLKAKYKNKPLEISGNVWIKGKVVSSDRSGNIYKEIYIQDETGGIDLKLGKSSLYSEYALGQTLYVLCDGLTLGAYNGMPQLGLQADQTATNEYETSYIDLQVVINEHVFKGALGTPVEPQVVTEEDVKASLSSLYTGELWGKYVTIKGLKYDSYMYEGTHVKQVFGLFYPNPNLPHKNENPENRVFISTPKYQDEFKSGFDYTWGVTTWACSKAKYEEYLTAGLWDEAEVGSGSTKYGKISEVSPKSAGLTGKALDSFTPDQETLYRDIMIKNSSANYISHYFLIGTTNIQVRTSGYARFADQEIDPAILDGTKTVDITGILTLYVSSSGDAAQFTLVDDPSISVKVY